MCIYYREVGGEGRRERLQQPGRQALTHLGVPLCYSVIQHTKAKLACLTVVVNNMKNNNNNGSSSSSNNNTTYNSRTSASQTSKSARARATRPTLGDRCACTCSL